MRIFYNGFIILCAHGARLEMMGGLSHAPTIVTALYNKVDFLHKAVLPPCAPASESRRWEPHTTTAFTLRALSDI